MQQECSLAVLLHYFLFLMRLTMVILSIAVSSICCTGCVPNQEEQANAAAWVQHHQTPFGRIQSDTTIFSYSLHYDSIFSKDIKVLGLGEATHGTHESSVMNCEIIKYMVLYKNCKAICMEAHSPYVLVANDYILGRIANTDLQILKTAFIKPSQPFKELLEWLRAYNNTSTTNKVQIYGVCYGAPDDAAHYVLDFLKKNDSSFYNVIGKEYRRVCNQRIKTDTAHLASRVFSEWSVDIPLDSIQHWRLISRQVYTHLLKNRDIYHPIDSYTTEVAICSAKYLMQNFHRPYMRDKQYRSFWGSLLQTIGFPQYEQNRSFNLNYYYKDSTWAANAIDIVQRLQPDQTAVIWAHNLHVGRIITARTHRMGAYLNGQFGKKYQALGYYFGAGTFVSADAEDRQVKFFSANSAPIGSLEHIFSAALPPNTTGMILQTNSTPLPQFFSSSILSRVGARIASVSEPTKFVQSNPFQEFDVLVYFRETTAEKRFSGKFAP